MSIIITNFNINLTKKYSKLINKVNNNIYYIYFKNRYKNNIKILENKQLNSSLIIYGKFNNIDDNTQNKILKNILRNFDKTQLEKSESLKDIEYLTTDLHYFTAIYINHNNNYSLVFGDIYNACTIYYIYSKLNNHYIISNRIENIIQYSNNNIDCTNSVTSINYASIIESLHCGYALQPNTLFENIKKLSTTKYIEINNNIIGIKYRSPSNHPQIYDKTNIDNINHNKNINSKNIEYYINNLLNNIILQSDYVTRNSKNIAILWSGGNDSTALLSLYKNYLDKNITLITCLPSNINSPDYYNINKLKKIFNIKNKDHYILSPSQTAVFDNIESAIKAGEADIIGVNSLNAAVEYLIIKQIAGQFDTCITGDYFLKDLKTKHTNITDFNNSNFLYSYHRVIDEDDLLYLNPDILNNYFTRFNHNTDYLYNNFIDFGKNRFQSFAMSPLSKIRNYTAKDTNFIFPTQTSFLNNYIDSIPENITNISINTKIDNINLLHYYILKKLIPNIELPLEKCWLQSPFQYNFDSKIKDIILNKLSNNNSILYKLFNKNYYNKLKDDFNNKQFNYEKKIFALYYLDIYYSSLNKLNNYTSDNLALLDMKTNLE